MRTEKKNIEIEKKVGQRGEKYQEKLSDVTNFGQKKKTRYKEK